MTSLSINPSVAFGNHQTKMYNSEYPQKDIASRSSKSKKALAIGVGLGAAAAVGVAIYNRKSIIKFLTSKFNKLTKLFKNEKKSPATVFDTTLGYSPDTKNLIKEVIVKMNSNETIAASEAARASELAKMREDAIAAFTNLKVDA